jgi:hypothetical protein
MPLHRSDSPRPLAFDVSTAALSKVNVMEREKVNQDDPVAHRKRIVAALAAACGIPICPVCGEVYWHENDDHTVESDGCACTAQPQR